MEGEASQAELHDLGHAIVEPLQSFAPKDEPLQVSWDRGGRAVDPGRQGQVPR